MQKMFVEENKTFLPLLIKVKVKFSLCFNWAPCHEGVLREWGYSQKKRMQEFHVIKRSHLNTNITSLLKEVKV